ncbi:hypothetical protein ZWY2020_020145 [Hordeum vulgare]|nr:hypothetical protein ZWY2020_020145 [Hordeum vulgare]
METPSEWPHIYRYDVELGLMDGRSSVPARSSCASVRHARHRDGDADDEVCDRGHRRRSSARRRSVWQKMMSQAQCRDSDRHDPEPRRVRRREGRQDRAAQERHHRAPSRSASEGPRWCPSPSPPPVNCAIDSQSSFTSVKAGSLARRGSRPAATVAPASPTVSATPPVASTPVSPTRTVGRISRGRLEHVPCPSRAPSSVFCVGGPSTAAAAPPSASLSPLDEVIAATGRRPRPADPWTVDASGFSSAGDGQAPFNLAFPALGVASDQPGMLLKDSSSEALPSWCPASSTTQFDLPMQWGTRQQHLPPAGLDYGLLSDLVAPPAYRSIWGPRFQQTEDISAMPPFAPTQSLSPEVLFGPGTQLPVDSSIQEARARAALAQANLSGHGLLSAITASVSDLQIDEQRQFFANFISSMPPSLLGSPPHSQQRGSAFAYSKKKTLTSIFNKHKCQTAPRPSMASSRRTQARICKALGMISSEDQFSDATMQAYNQFFKKPMCDDLAAGLSSLAGLDSPAAINLPESDLQAILEEVLVRAA